MNCHNNNKNDVNDDVNKHEDKSEHKHEHKHQHSGHKHGLMMLLCMLPLAIIMIYIMISGNKINNSPWLYLIILLCPLSHIFMMFGNNRHKDSKDKRSTTKED